MGGLHPQLEEWQMKEYFEKFGPTEQCVIMHDKPTGKSRGFGFVIYINESSADLVMLNKNQHCILGKWVDCKRAMPKEVINKEMSQNLKEINSFKNMNYNNNFVTNDSQFNHTIYSYIPKQSNNILQKENKNISAPDNSFSNKFNNSPNSVTNMNSNTNLPINQNWVVNNYCKFFFFL